jgi:hypothetical protein
MADMPKHMHIINLTVFFYLIDTRNGYWHHSTGASTCKFDITLKHVHSFVVQKNPKRIKCPIPGFVLGINHFSLSGVNC